MQAQLNSCVSSELESFHTLAPASFLLKEVLLAQQGCCFSRSHSPLIWNLPVRKAGSACPKPAWVFRESWLLSGHLRGGERDFWCFGNYSRKPWGLAWARALGTKPFSFPRRPHHSPASASSLSALWLPHFRLAEKMQVLDRSADTSVE